MEDDLQNRHPLEQALSAYAAEAIPDDLDLWPAISSRLPARPGRKGHAQGVLGALGTRPFRRIALMSLAAGVLVAILVLAGPLWSGRPEVSASAAEILSGLAKVAAAQPGASVGAATGYRYTKSENAYLTTTAYENAHENAQPYSVLVPKMREIWIAADGSGLIRETAGEPVFLGPQDRARWEAVGSPPLVHTINEDFGPGELYYEDFLSLPTDPQALAAVIRERASKSDPPVDVEMFVVVGDLLRETSAPPELRAALYKVAAKIDGVELVGNVTDRAGRPGVAVAKTTGYWGAKQRLVLIFDPVTSALLGEEHVLLERAGWIDAKPPAVIGYATYLASGIVPELPR